MAVYTYKWSDVDEAIEVDLPDGNAAWSDAVESVAGVLRDIDGSIADRGELPLQVMDGNGRFFGSVCVTAKRSPG